MSSFHCFESLHFECGHSEGKRSANSLMMKLDKVQ
jgi:hypothetical protein